ncbi:MAG: hypothetical protein K2Q21_12025 [Chitinophagaceae bacterium]|nr:hypothetical protein [Chitinophagaceae bacterium]
MQVNDLSYTRLKPDREEKVRKMLKEGSDKIIQDLSAHYQHYDASKSDDVFTKSLEIIAETISKVASIQEFCYEGTGECRIAFLPGYMKKNRHRITYKINYNGIQIPSDIVFKFKENSTIPEQIKEITNQSLLYYYLLYFHEDDMTFLNGGTHQFLIANEQKIISDDKYHVDVLQIATVRKKPHKRHPKEEITFIKIDIDFEQLNSVDKLYKHLDSKLNKGMLPFRWPYNRADEKELKKSKKEATYKMRGYLISLWYKLLYDEDEKNNEQWFNDCIHLSNESGFKQLKDRIEQLKKEYKKNLKENYQFWYSLRFNSLPDFTTPHSTAMETIGSAMLMTNFQLHPSYFFYVKPWLNRIYKYLRDFENKILIEQKTLERISNDLFGKSDYIPKKISGERLTTASTNSGFLLPIGKYYWMAVESGTDRYQSLFDNAINDAKNALTTIFKIYFLNLIQQWSVSNDNEKKIEKLHIELGDIDLQREYHKECGEIDDVAIGFFCNKIFGREFSLGCHLILNLSCAAIHSFVVGNGEKNFDANERYGKNGKGTSHSYIVRNFFIHGIEDDKRRTSAKIQSKPNIYNHLSIHEKKFLKIWLHETMSSIDSLLMNAPVHMIERVKKHIEDTSLPPELRSVLDNLK